MVSKVNRTKTNSLGVPFFSMHAKSLINPHLHARSTKKPFDDDLNERFLKTSLHLSSDSTITSILKKRKVNVVISLLGILIQATHN